jgi:hypothetical protein
MDAGQRLLERIQDDLKAERLELTGVEQELVDRAVSIARHIEALERVVEETGPTTRGHRGLIVSPALTEIRHMSGLLKILLGGLRIEDPDAVNVAKSQAGKAGAAAKWGGRRAS